MKGRACSSFPGLIRLAILLALGLSGVSGFGLRNFLLSTNSNDIKFYLYPDQSDTAKCEEIVHGNNQSLANSNYNTSRPLILLLHGALSNFKTTFDVQQLKDAYLETKTEANIVMVDYGKLVQPTLPLLLSKLSVIHFVTGHFRTDRIGRRVANFILFLMGAKAVSGPESVRLVGLSLGAHAAGSAGRHVRTVTSKKVARITGLDPSPQYLPLRSILLDPSDAEFVDVTFTSFGPVHLVRKRGHVQFFVNGGGLRQPTCPRLFPFLEPYCGHALASVLYAKSIRSHSTLGCSCARLFCGSLRPPPGPCNQPTVFGESVPTGTRGNFYVNLR